jgi:hypothetical protein
MAGTSPAMTVGIWESDDALSVIPAKAGIQGNTH